MTAARRGPSRRFQAFDLLVVVGVSVVAVSASGVVWSLLRVGRAEPTYVREAQFLAGLLVLLAWVVRNRAGRGPRRGRTGEAETGPGNDAGPSAFAAWRREAFGRLGGSASTTSNEALGTDAYLLATGAVLVVLALGGEALGLPPG